jgi:arabinofuranosyltransferase
VIALVTSLTIARSDRNVRAACIGMVVAAVAHAGYITVAGGDYMHGRLLLPALFAFALPASIVLARGDLLVAGLVVAGAAWAVVCAGTLRFREQPTAAMLPDIIDFRDRSGIEAGVVHVEGPSEGYLSPVEIAELDAAGRTGYIRVLADEVVPAGTGGRLVVVFGSIGVPSYRTGIDVWVVDLGGLGEPLAARSPVIPGRPAGHRKQIDPAWHEARWGVEQPDDPGAAAAARDAMACGPIRDLLDAVTEPMTPGRFLRNAWSSVRFTSMEVPDDPRDAAPCR